MRVIRRVYNTFAFQSCDLEVPAVGTGSTSILYIQGGPKVSLHTLGLIPTSCFKLEGCCFADGILYLLVRGFRRQNLKIRISYTTPIQY